MKKRWIILLSVIGLLLVLRIALPFIVKNYVNKTLRDMEGYTGSVSDVDMNLFRGAYVIDSIEIKKTGDSIPVPFVSIAKTDISVQWNALFKGAIKGEVILKEPVVNFAKSGGKSTQDGSEADWTETLKELVPLQINRFEIIDGQIHYRDFSTSPEVDVKIENLDLLATNLSNVESKDLTLPSTLNATATSIGGGTLNIDAKMNILKQVPDLDLNLEFERVDMTALNDFVKAYTKTDVERGTFNLYTEVAIDNAQLTGYVKPVIENLKIVEWNKEEGGFLQKTWESVVGAVTELFENQPEDQIATRTPLNGDLNNLDVGFIPTVWNIFKNAFIDALSKRVDNTINFSNNNDK